MRKVTFGQRLRYGFDNTMARGTPALVGCDRTVSEDKTTHTNPDTGKTTEKEKKVEKTPDGGTKTTEEKKQTSNQ